MPSSATAPAGIPASGTDKASFYFESGHPWFKYNGTETKIAAGGSAKQ